MAWTNVRSAAPTVSRAQPSGPYSRQPTSMVPGLNAGFIGGGMYDVNKAREQAVGIQGNQDNQKKLKVERDNAMALVPYHQANLLHDSIQHYVDMINSENSGPQSRRDHPVYVENPGDRFLPSLEKQLARWTPEVAQLYQQGDGAQRAANQQSLNQVVAQIADARLTPDEALRQMSKGQGRYQTQPRPQVAQRAVGVFTPGRNSQSSFRGY